MKNKTYKIQVSLNGDWFNCQQSFYDKNDIEFDNLDEAEKCFENRIQTRSCLSYRIIDSEDNVIL